MKAIAQRVKNASLSVEGELISSIDKGLVVFLGVKQGDVEAQAERIAYKIVNLRVFEDAITFKIALMVVKYMKYMETLEY